MSTTSISDHPRGWQSMLPRALQRFPFLQESLAPSPLGDPEAFISYLAHSHHLTLTEAREEAEDFLFMESLWREIQHSADP